MAHVAVKLNTRADKQSRKLKDDIESPLKTDLFEKLRNIVETMDKHSFTSRLNKIIGKFNTLPISQTNMRDKTHH